MDFYRKIEEIFHQDNCDKLINELRLSGELKKYLPEVDNLYNCIQSYRYHKEGNAFKHTMLVVKNTRELLKENPELSKKRYNDIMWAALLHDIGKPLTATLNKYFDVSNKSHDIVGADMFLNNISPKLNLSKNSCDYIYNIIAQHMNFYNFRQFRFKTAVNLVKQEYFDGLVIVCTADDKSSFNKLPYIYDENKYDSLKEYITELKDIILIQEKYPKKLLHGSDLIELGFKDFKSYSHILYNVRLNQTKDILKTKEEAIEYVTKTFLKD